MCFILDPKLDRYFSPGYNLNKYSSSRIDNRSLDKLLIYNNCYTNATVLAEVETTTIIISTKRKCAVSVDDPQPNNNNNSEYKGNAAQQIKEATIN